MSFELECKKVKRTGYIPAFICGGMVAAAVPILNMVVCSNIYIGLSSSPVQILLDANWKMMAMLNVLLIVLGACMIYHTEYADNAIQKMCTLPLTESKLFSGKFALMAIMCIVTLATEAVGIAFSLYHWFEFSKDVGIELFKSFGYSLLLTLPAVLTALLIASVCKNMWVSLGIGVVCVFIATMLPMDNFVLSLFPFALPFQVFVGMAENTFYNFLIAGVIESVILFVTELVILKVRRSFE